MALCPGSLTAIYIGSILVLALAILTWIRHAFGKRLGLKWLTLILIILTVILAIIHYNVCEPVPTTIWILLFAAVFLQWLDHLIFHKRPLKVKAE